VYSQSAGPEGGEDAGTDTPEEDEGSPDDEGTVEGEFREV